MFKSALVYRIASDWIAPSFAALEDALQRNRFAPCGPTEPRSAGWVEPRGRDNGALLEPVGRHLMFSLRTETRAVPAAVVKASLDERLQRVEDETGTRPRGKRRKEFKEEVVIDLLPRAFGKVSTTRLWLDPDARLLVVGVGSLARADEAVAALLQAFRDIGSELPVSLVKTGLSPSTAMSRWLTERDAPAGFSIDRECELQQAVPAQAAGGADAAAAARAIDAKATVRYARHSLDIDEIVEHIEQGKVATKLAMTWRDRVSFLLDATMTLKRIEILDVVLEAASGGDRGDGDDGFDADVAIATAELGRLIPDLIEALGGEIEADAVSAPAAPAPGRG